MPSFYGRRRISVVLAALILFQLFFISTAPSSAAPATPGITLSTNKVSAGYSTPVSITATASGDVAFDLDGTDVKIIDGTDTVVNSVQITDINVQSTSNLSFTLGTGLIAGNYQIRFLKAGADPYYADFAVVTPTITLGTTSIPNGYTASVNIAVAGTNTNFAAGQTTVAVLDSQNNVTGKAGTPNITNATSLSFSLATGLAVGTYTVKVTTSNEIVTAPLTVRNQSIQVTPNTASVGYNAPINMNVTGTDTAFSAAETSVSLLKDGQSAATLTNLNVASATALSFTIPIGLTAGTYQVKVTTGLEVVTANFTVNSATIELRENGQPLAPIIAGYNTNKAIAVRGTNTNFNNTSIVTIKDAGNVDYSAKVSSVTSTSATDLTFTLGTGLGEGTYTVTVETNGVKASANFTVNAAKITTNIDGTTFSKDYAAAKTITVTGTNTNFQSGITTVRVRNAADNAATGLAASLNVASTTSLTFNLNTGIAAGTYKVCETTNGIETCSATFTTTAASATVAPSTLPITMAAQTVTITGTNSNFTSGTTTVSFLNEDLTAANNVTVSGTTVISPTSLTVNLTTSTDLTNGANYKLRIVTNNATINESITATVTANSTRISIQGSTTVKEGISTTLTVQGTGTNFTGDSIVQVEGGIAPLDIANFTVTSATLMSVTLPDTLLATAGPPKANKAYTLKVGDLSTAFTVMPVISLNVSGSANTVQVGGTLQLTATATYSDTSTANVTNSSQIVWSSNNAAATVSQSGLVTGVSEGTATVSATINGTTKTYDVTVGTTTYQISGSIALSDFTGDLKDKGHITIELGTVLTMDGNNRPVMAAVNNGVTVTLNADGTFAITNVPAGNYGLIIKAKGYGIKYVTDLTVNANAIIDAITLTAGDVDQNGIIESADLAAIVTRYNNPSAGSEQADFDRNGLIESADLSKVVTKYNNALVEVIPNSAIH